jgi:hypothetical protein
MSKYKRWEFSLVGTDSYKSRLPGVYVGYSNACEFAEEVAEVSRDGKPEDTTVYVWLNGEYQGSFLVKPEIRVDWVATEIQEER